MTIFIRNIIIFGVNIIRLPIEFAQLTC